MTTDDTDIGSNRQHRLSDQVLANTYASISTRSHTPISVRSLTNESRTALSDG